MKRSELVLNAEALLGQTYERLAQAETLRQRFRVELKALGLPEAWAQTSTYEIMRMQQIIDAVRAQQA